MMMQIQPNIKNIDSWTAFALRQGLSFEFSEVSVEPLLSDEAGRSAVCADLRRSGLVTSLHGAFIDINPASGDPVMRQLSRRRCEESCIAAQALGASAVVFHSSCFPFLRGDYIARWADLCAEFYCELARRFDLTLLIENSMDVDTAPLQELMRRTDCKQVGICLDIGHASYSRIPLERWFDDFGNRICCLHLSDNGGCFDDHLPLGCGTVDWKKADGLWRQIGMPERLTLEVGDLSGVEQSLTFLKENRLFGMEEN